MLGEEWELRQAGGRRDQAPRFLPMRPIPALFVGQMAKKDHMTELNRICQETADQTGYELVDVALETEASARYLRVYLDAPAGITLDDCERYHRLAQPRLEAIEYDYLEVSSPGIDRPIRTQRDFQRAEGKEVEVRLYKPISGKKTYRGILTGLSDSGYRLLTAEGEMLFPVREVALARRTIDMEKALKTDERSGGGPA